jgi:hypothetical protein
MKTADAVVDDIALAVRPPRGVAIVLTERPDGTPNWIAAAGIMDAGRTGLFTAEVAALRISDPVVDWSACEQVDGSRRRVAKWLSEIATK